MQIANCDLEYLNEIALLRTACCEGVWVFAQRRPNRLPISLEFVGSRIKRRRGNAIINAELPRHADYWGGRGFGYGPCVWNPPVERPAKCIHPPFLLPNTIMIGELPNSRRGHHPPASNLCPFARLVWSAATEVEMRHRRAQ